MSTPAIVVLLLCFLRLGHDLAKDGQDAPKISFVGSLFNVGLFLYLLWLGGFFHPPA